MVDSNRYQVITPSKYHGLRFGKSEASATVEKMLNMHEL